MKRFNTILNLLFLLMISAGMTSCQGLIDAIIGDFDLSSSTTPPTTPKTKKAATISFAATSVGKTFGDDPFVNPLTNTGDSKVAYVSSNTAVATVNAATGQVTIVGNGTTTITAIVADTDNYTYATKTAQYTLGVGTATMTISASGYSGTYDGEAHSITVTVISPADATVKYGTTEGTYDLDASPTYTNAGTYTVYYQVSKPDYTIVTGSANVTIEKKAAAIHLEEEPDADAIDIRAEYVAKNGAPSAAAPKIFFRYYFVDSSTGVKSQEMLAECKWAAAAAEDPGEGD